MTGSWTVPGYAVDERLDVDATGETWRARRLADDAPVVLRRFSGADEATWRQLRADAAVVGALAHPHLAAVDDVVRLDDDVVVVRGVCGRRLPDLLADRDGLDAGETVTLLAPLADALAALHERGMSHGRVDVDHVEVAGDGRPVLVDAGVSAVARRSPSAPGDDVLGLGRLGVGVLRAGTDVPTGLEAALDAATGADAAHRPTAAELTAALLTACPARPLAPARRAARAPGPVEPAEEQPAGPPAAAPTPVHTSRRFPIRPAVAAVAAVALAVTAGTAWGNRAHPSAATPMPGVTRSATPSATAVADRPDQPSPYRPTDWRAVVTRIEQARAAAVRDGDVAALRRIYLRSCPTGRRESRALARLVTDGWQVRGFRPRVRRVTPKVVLPGRAVVRVVDELPATRLVATATHAVRRRDARPAAAVLLTLVRRGDRWLIARVAQPSSAPSAASMSS